MRKGHRTVVVGSLVATAALLAAGCNPKNQVVEHVDASHGALTCPKPGAFSYSSTEAAPGVSSRSGLVTRLVPVPDRARARAVFPWLCDRMLSARGYATLDGETLILEDDDATLERIEKALDQMLDASSTTDIPVK